MKQVIIIRKDLKMRRGKEIVQGAHSSLKAYKNAEEIQSKYDFPGWLNGLQKKICVTVQSEQELLDLYQKALSNGLPVGLVKDAGLTEFKEPTLTALAIGPADENEIDKITGHLKLY